MATLEKNQKTAAIISMVVVGMVGLGFAAVPAYKAFCQVTGWGGTTQRADAAADLTLSRKITVQFDASTNARLPWSFNPEQVSQTLKIGETGLAFYEAENLTDKPISGRATFNVSPAKAGIYFRKIECFCFTQQTLMPGQKVSMPVTYFVDPDLDNDRNLDEVETIILSYTFFPWEDGPGEGPTAAE